MSAYEVGLVVWTALVAGLALLSVAKAPIRALWKPAVIATEGGYLLLPLCLPPLLAAEGHPMRGLLVGAGAISGILFSTGLVRAWPVARSLEAAMDRSFAGAPRGSERGSPLGLRRLLSFGSPHVSVETHVYSEPDRPLALDLYRSSGEEAQPLIVIVHGGAWHVGDRKQLPAMARRLAASGYAVAAIDYRLAPTHRFPAAYDDVRAAVDFLRSRADDLGIDRDRVILYGRSAGGHLALLAAYRWREPFVRGVVALYAPTDMHWGWEHPTNPLVLDTREVLASFLGGPPDASSELHQRYTDASPIAHVDPSAPPTLLVHGGRDELVRPRQTDRLAAALEEARVPHLAMHLPWATHGCEASLAGPSGQLVEYAVRRFLAYALRREAAATSVDRDDYSSSRPSAS